MVNNFFLQLSIERVIKYGGGHTLSGETWAMSAGGTQYSKAARTDRAPPVGYTSMSHGRSSCRPVSAYPKLQIIALRSVSSVSPSFDSSGIGVVVSTTSQIKPSRCG